MTLWQKKVNLGDEIVGWMLVVISGGSKKVNTSRLCTLGYLAWDTLLCY